MNRVCQRNIPAEHRIIKAVAAGCLFFGILILFLVPPVHLPVPSCAFHSITGHSCLTCGLTRSLHAISHGDLAGSARYHLFGPAVFLGMLLCLALFAFEAISGRKLALSVSGKTRNRFIGMWALLWFAYWGIRLAAEFVV